jgi:diketogulonate reductase-like aldo/keto reductase
MQIPTKRCAGGFELPVYGLGMWQMGGRWERDSSRDGAEVEAVQAAIALGIRHIDTAEGYGDGHAEELLGEAIRGVDRNRLLIATKVSEENQSYAGVKRACEASLKRMGTDYVDLYLLHAYPLPNLPIQETMRAMDELVDEGLVRQIGVCNLTPRRFDEAQRWSRHRLVCNQLHYNLQVREVETWGLLEHCRAKDAMLVAWRPVEKGAMPAAPVVAELAKKYGKTPTQIAINWLISQDHVVTICKTSSVAHLKENLGAVGWTMEPADIERLQRQFPNQKPVSGSVPLDYEGNTPP